MEVRQIHKKKLCSDDCEQYIVVLWIALVVFWVVSKLVLFLEDLDELVRAELINVIFCYQSLLYENHSLPKKVATKY